MDKEGSIYNLHELACQQGTANFLRSERISNPTPTSPSPILTQTPSANPQAPFPKCRASWQTSSRARKPGRRPPAPLQTPSPPLLHPSTHAHPTTTPTPTVPRPLLPTARASSRPPRHPRAVRRKTATRPAQSTSPPPSTRL